MKKNFLSFMFCLYLLPQICYADAYNVANDFSSSNNPNNVWSYGLKNSKSAEFELLNESFTSSTGLVSWGAITSFPSIVYNSTDNVLNVYNKTNSVKPHSVVFHPGPKGEFAIIRWTAPENGSYMINAVAEGRDHVYPTSSEVSILHNSQKIWSVYINDYNKTYSFSKKLFVSLGDSIDFSCGFGSNGNYYGDTTGIDIVITKIDECNFADSDEDGVIDLWDKCPETPLNSYVNRYGCPESDNSVLSGRISLKGQPLTNGNATLFQSGELFQKVPIDINGCFKFDKVAEDKSINIMLRRTVE